MAILHRLPQRHFCASCEHRTQAGTCGEPDAAGLCAPDRYELIWCELLPAERQCVAWQQRIKPG